MSELIEVKNLKKYFETPKGMLHAVDDVTMSIRAGETMGVVGESGCGKSPRGRPILRLLPSTDGHIYFDGEDITGVTSKKELRELHKKAQLIFQDPYSSLNPRMTVEDTLKDLIDGQTNPTIATYAKTGEVHIRVTASGEDTKAAGKAIKPVVKELKSRFGADIYSTKAETTLEMAVADLPMI